MEAKAQEEVNYKTPKVIPNKEETPYYNQTIHDAIYKERM